MSEAEIIQGSPEWFAIRCGKVTASRVADIIRKTKSGYSTSRANYMAQLIAERLTQTVAPSFTNAAMQWGTDNEPNARVAYELMRDCDVTEIGFVVHPTIPMAGASPDGLIGADGLAEFKCPLTATHLDTLLGTPVSQDYDIQVQWQMACTKRLWCDWVSFDPRLPAAMQLHIQRIKRDDVMVASLEKDVTAFLAELDDKLSRLRDRYEPKAAA